MDIDLQILNEFIAFTKTAAILPNQALATAISTSNGGQGSAQPQAQTNLVQPPVVGGQPPARATNTTVDTMAGGLATSGAGKPMTKPNQPLKPINFKPLR